MEVQIVRAPGGKGRKGLGQSCGAVQWLLVKELSPWADPRLAIGVAAIGVAGCG